MSQVHSVSWLSGESVGPARSNLDRRRLATTGEGTPIAATQLFRCEDSQLLSSDHRSDAHREMA